MVQGFLISRPLPAPEFVALLSREPFVRLVMATADNEAVASTV